jgi:hypothetical protein
MLRLLAGTAALATSAHAQSGSDLATLKAEIEALRAEYDAKIDALEAKVKAAEAADARHAAAVPSQSEDDDYLAAASANQAEPQAPSPDDAYLSSAAAAPSVDGAAAADDAYLKSAAMSVEAAPVSRNAYNPGVSVVLNGTFAAYENDPGAAVIPGFPLGEEAGLEDRGFSLGESELALNANIDHRVYGNLIFALTDEGEVEVEEAYIQTTSLPGGITLKGGKFFSGIGYLNENHAHNWDFIDAPLPYRAFLGNQLGDIGLQARWIAPTDFYLEVGAEAMRGDAFPAGGAANRGVGTYAGYVQTGGDIGASSSWLAKFSYLHAKSDERDVNGDLFSGRDALGIVSLVYKWAPGGNPTVNNLIVNGEYFFGNEKGDFNFAPIDIDRSGFYLQGVFQLRKNWRIGARYARLMSESAAPGVVTTALDDVGRSPDAITALFEFDTSEFSRFRLQYTYDDTDLRTKNEFLARYTVIFGPHGAHRF